MNNIGVRNSDTVSNEIRILHDTHGLSWRQIAALPGYSGVPPGTLCSIYHGTPIPNKHRPTVGLPLLVKVRADMVKSEPQPPRNLTRCTFYKTTDPAKIVRDLQRVTGLMFELVE